MKAATSLTALRVQRLCELLGYTPASGWVPAAEFEQLKAHRFALVQAHEAMNVAGAFCWLCGEEAGAVSAPLVYVAVAETADQAQAIHHKVWSQGLVPFLIVITPKQVLLCQGFKYERATWGEKVHALDLDLTSPPTAAHKHDLSNLRAERLRASLFWREFAIDVSGRVDQVVLTGLNGLSRSLIAGIGVSHALHHEAANALIGKVLYLYFLADRGVINQKWLASRGHAGIDLGDAEAVWRKDAFWHLIDDLDGIFNGSIFPVSTRMRRQIDDTHIRLTRSVLKFGAVALSDGSVQLSLIDVDLSVLRVETLSAIYEQFLENVRSGERRTVGAFYTPPFLADLLLDRVEHEQPFIDGVRVLDPAAGSGVFLVGAFRRIVENTLAKLSKPAKRLALAQVRGLLVNNIYGVERNADACHVTAFSLYLTMLDYVSPRDLGAVAKGDDPSKLFPTLVGSNLLATDFFSPEVKELLPSIHCVIGNPPWQTLDKLTSMPAAAWREAHSDCPIGNDQAAELFVWKALREHLVSDGVMAVLIPSKSFVNPTAARFRSGLMAEATITGAINFSHMRYKLFPGARHACAALLVRKRLPTTADWTWVYTPLSISQPVASKDAPPWTLVIDRAEVQRLRHQILASRPSGWFDAFVLRPVDRQIKQFIEDRITVDSEPMRSIMSMRDLCEHVGARHKRGGDSKDTNVPAKYFETHHSLEFDEDHTLDLFDDTPIGTGELGDLLPSDALETAHARYRNQFSGNFLLVPRSFRGIRFVSYPKAYNSSFLAVFFDKPGTEVTLMERQLLLALERYLNSKIAMYFVATSSRRWLMDRRNIEPEDFARLPVPFSSLNDERAMQLLKLAADEVDAFILKAFGFDADQCCAIEEFLRFRMGFQDGNVPSEALAVPSRTAVETYTKIFKHNLEGLFGREGTFSVSMCRDTGIDGFGLVVAHHGSRRSSSVGARELQMARERVVNAWSSGGRNSFADSAAVFFDGPTSTVYTFKPLEYFRWTADWAFADSRRAMQAIMDSAC